MPTVMEILTQRRARKRRVSEAQRPEQPRRFELEYTTALLSVIREWNALVKRELRPHLEWYARRDVLVGPALKPLRSLRQRARTAVEERTSKAAKRVGDKVDKFAREEMARTVAITVGKPLEPVIETFRRENVELVTSIADRQLDELELLLSDAGTMRVESLQKQIFERFDVAESRAALIARDQVLKLNSEIQQTQQINAGVAQYVWATARDERVREDHQKLDGTTHDWALPPVVNSDTGERAHPGKSIQCRCQAIPVLD
jgi:SPP1 gp7 family putative phage head morphogenesis protein